MSLSRVEGTLTSWPGNEAKGYTYYTYYSVDCMHKKGDLLMFSGEGCNGVAADNVYLSVRATLS